MNFKGGFLAYKTSKDLFEKLTRDYQNLINNESTDTYYNFIFTAYHLSEWMKNDGTFTNEEFTSNKKILNDNNLKLFSELANISKHYRYNRNVTFEDNYKPPFSYENFSYDSFSYGEVFSLKQDGKEIDILQECKNIFESYKSIFQK